MYDVCVCVLTSGKVMRSSQLKANLALQQQSSSNKILKV